MSCGINIPLSSVVEAIINEYSDALVSEILKHIDLTDATLDNITLKGGLTVDEATKAAMCSILQDCIAAKIQEELGCERDNHVTKFYIDKVNDHLVIELKFGEKFYVSKDEIINWLNIKDLFINNLTFSGTTLTAHRNDGTTFSVDLKSLIGGVTSGSVNNYVLTLVNRDGTTVDIQLPTNTLPTTGENSPNNDKFLVSGVADSSNNKHYIKLFLNDGSVVSVDITRFIKEQIPAFTTANISGNTLVLHRTDGTREALILPDTDVKVTNFRINGNTLILENSDSTNFSVNLPTTVSGVDTNTKLVNARIDNNTLVLENDDGSSVRVDLPTSTSTADTNTKLINARLDGNTLILENDDGSEVTVDLAKFVDVVSDTICKSSIVTPEQTYTVDTSNLGKNITVRLPSTFTELILTSPSDDYIGASITIRDIVNSDTPFIVTLQGVTLSPPVDFSKIKRAEGRTFTFMYVGNNVYDVYGG